MAERRADDPEACAWAESIPVADFPALVSRAASRVDLASTRLGGDR
jgi:hypothetical protein